MFIAATVLVAARHGHGGWLSHNWLIVGLIAIAVVGLLLYLTRSDSGSGSCVEPEPDPVRVALEARLNDLEPYDHSEICYLLARKTSAHQGALDDAMREIEATKDDEAEV